MKIDMHMITGFLGSGKSCATIHLIDHSPGRNGLVVADVAELNVDEALIRDAKTRGIAVDAVSGVTSDVEPLLEAISGVLEQDIHRLFVETSGVAQAELLLTAIRENPELKQRLRFKRNLTIIDAGAFNYHHSEFTDQVESQIAVGDIIVLNKRDLLSEEELEQLVETVSAMAPGVVVVSAYQGQVSLGLLTTDEEETPRILGHRSVEVEELDTFVYETDEILYEQLRFGHALLNMPFTFVRIKGDLRDNERGRFINAVPGQLDWLRTDRPITRTALVFIGRFDSDELKRYVDELYESLRFK